MNSLLQRRQFSFLALIFQGIFVVLFGIFGRYDWSPTQLANNQIQNYYTLFQDIHVMVIIGFGFLMSFLRRYGFSAISVNLLLSAFVIQYVILLRGFLSIEFVSTGFFKIFIKELIIADLSCVTVLITMGILLGKLTPVQFLILAFIETSFSVILEHIIFDMLHINDAGRCFSVHCFGTYFGLAAAKVCRAKTLMADQENFNNSEMFSMIGSLFLWIFFPSFNAALQENDDLKQRAILNTYLAIVSCTTTTFLLSSFYDHLGRFNIIHIQISTLAGGIAIGSVSNLILYPHHALLIGFMAGVVSIWGHVFISPKILEKRLSLYDTCGVHNLHGLPGLLAGIFSIFFVLYYDPNEYGNSIKQIYPHWQLNQQNSTLLIGENEKILGFERSQFIQALCQTAGLAITILMAIFGGILSGWVMNISLLNQVKLNPSYEDKNYFLQAEFSIFGKLDNGFIIADEFDTHIDTHMHHNYGHNNEHFPTQIKAVY